MDALSDLLKSEWQDRLQGVERLLRLASYRIKAMESDDLLNGKRQDVVGLRKQCEKTLEDATKLRESFRAKVETKSEVDEALADAVRARKERVEEEEGE